MAQPDSPVRKRLKQTDVMSYFRAKESTSGEPQEFQSASDLPGTSAQEEINDGPQLRSTPADQRCVDIGLVTSGDIPKECLTDDQRFQLLTNHFSPPHDFKMFSTEVVRGQMKKTLTFQRAWLGEYSWLAYSPSQQGGYCKFCALFGYLNKGHLKTLVTEPFKKLNKAKGKDGILSSHEGFQYHQEAAVAAKEFVRRYKNPDLRINQALDLQKQQQSDKNKHILHKIVEIILLCGRQAIPLRGHREDRSADLNTNRGNFLAILDMLAKSDPLLQEHLEFGKRNQRYTSKAIQNEIITVISRCIKEKILAALSNVRYYSIMADEVTDRYSNQEILSLCVRFVDLLHADAPEIKEVFLDFLYLERTTGQHVADGIIKLLAKEGLEVKDIRGQSYDGAAAMSSPRVGVQARIRELNPLALYTHCNSHVLNLSIAAASKIQMVRNIIEIINTTYLFFHNSPKRQRFLEKVLGVYAPEVKGKKLKGLCKTRWVERHTCLESMCSMYEYIVTSLDAISNPDTYPDVCTEPWNWDTETIASANGLCASLRSFANIVALVVLYQTLDPVKALSQKLQYKDSDIFYAYSRIDEVRKEISDLRQNVDSVWGEWYSEATRIAGEVESEVSTPRTTRMQRHRSNVPAGTPSEYYKRAFAIPFLDNFHGQLEERFSPENRKLASI